MWGMTSWFAVSTQIHSKDAFFKDLLHPRQVLLHWTQVSVFMGLAVNSDVQPSWKRKGSSSNCFLKVSSSDFSNTALFGET